MCSNINIKNDCTVVSINIHATNNAHQVNIISLE